MSEPSPGIDLYTQEELDRIEEIDSDSIVQRLVQQVKFYKQWAEFLIERGKDQESQIKELADAKFKISFKRNQFYSLLRELEWKGHWTDEAPFETCPSCGGLGQMSELDKIDYPDLVQGHKKDCRWKTQVVLID